MNGDLHDISDPAEPEDDQKLWDLLAQSRRPETSPYFTRRVLRDAALLPQEHSSPALWRGLKAWWQAGLPLLRPPRAAAWPGAVVATFICMASVMMTFSNDSSRLRLSQPTEDWHSDRQEMVSTGPAATPDTAAAPETVSSQADDSSGTVAAVMAENPLTRQDAEVIADLDSLMMREETHLWTDDNPAY